VAEKKLTLKQEAFVQEYLKNGHNGTQAAISAGYSKKSAHAIAEENLRKPEIKSRVQTYKKKAQKRTEITQDKVIMEIAKVAFADIGLIATWDEEGNLSLRPSEELSKEQTAAIQSIQATDQYYQGEKIGTRMTYRMHDKLKALELLCKHLGILDGSGSGTGSDSGNDVTQRLRHTLRAFVGK
jgi:phage terminase small subunit